MAAIITLEGNTAHVDGENLPMRAIVDVTSYYKQGYKFTQKYKTGGWDGRIRLFSKFKRTFPIGLVDDVKQVLEDHEIYVMVDDQRDQPIIPPIDKNITLHGLSFDYPYDYQLDCMEKMILATRGVISLATNSGKTACAALVISCLRVHTLFIVPGKDLLYQARRQLMRYLGASEQVIGIVGDSKWQPGDWITVATINSLYRNLEKDRGMELLNCTDLLINDECHHCSSETNYKVLMSCPAYFRFGMSGTPLKRTDGADLKLIAAIGPVIYSVSNKVLIERGISNKVNIKFVRIDKPELDEKTPYKDVYKEGITNNLYRNRLFCRLAAKYVEQGKSVVLFIREIVHGEELDKRLWTFRQNSFIPHQFISGRESMDVRNKALSDFAKGELSVLITSVILDEGVDLPNIDVIIFCGGLKSSIKTLQRVGRGLRKGGTSDELIVIDTADFQHRYLLEHSLQRLEDYDAEGCFRIEVVDDI